MSIGFLAAVLVAFLVCGCVSDPSPASATPGRGREASSTRSPSTSDVPRGSNPTNDTRANSFEWWSADVQGSFAGAVTLKVAKTSECEATFATSSTVDGWGPIAVFVAQSEAGGGWSSTSAGGAIQAHGASVDTRTLLGPDGKTVGVTMIWWSDVQGVVTLRFAARGLTPWEGGGNGDQVLPAGASIRVAFNCGSPVEVLALEAGREVLLFNQESMNGGVGASAGGAASVAIDDAVSASFEAPHVVAVAGHFGAEAGFAELQGPDGATGCELGPLSRETLCEAEGGPGEWGVSLTRFAATVDVFSGAILGVGPVAALSETVPAPA